MNKTIPADYRDIAIITNEIKMLQHQTQRLVLEYAIEVGRRLTEAKELLPFGEWGKWLKDEVSFSQSTANNLMRIFNEYGAAQIGIFGAEANSQTLGKLSYSKALSLIAIPENERETFAIEHDVEHISSRELDKIIKERDAAKAEAEKQARDAKVSAAQTEATEKALKDQLIKAEKAAEKAKASEEKSKEELIRLKANPVIPPEMVEKIKKEAEQAATEKTKGTERELSQAKERIDDLQRQIKLSDPDTAVFKMLFETVQSDFSKLFDCIGRIEISNADTASKLRAACKRLIENFAGRLGDV